MITIFYLTNCGYSKKALETLEKHKLDHHKIESSNDIDERKKYYPTFPQIYWKDKLIGGNDDVTKIIQTLMSNKVPPMPEGWNVREWFWLLLNILDKLERN